MSWLLARLRSMGGIECHVSCYFFLHKYDPSQASILYD